VGEQKKEEREEGDKGNHPSLDRSVAFYSAHAWRSHKAEKKVEPESLLSSASQETRD
jgi:hypothetical protein